MTAARHVAADAVERRDALADAHAVDQLTDQVLGICRFATRRM